VQLVRQIIYISLAINSETLPGTPESLVSSSHVHVTCTRDICARDICPYILWIKYRNIAFSFFV